MIGLVIVGRKSLEDASFNLKRLSVLLSDKDYEIERVCFVDDGEDCEKAISEFPEDAVLILCGAIDGLREKIAPDTETTEYFSDGNRTFVPMSEFDESTVRNVLIPLLNAGNKNCTNTVVFKTFGKSEDELRERLGKLLKSRYRISFSFPSNDAGVDVRVKYARSTPSTAVTELIKNVSDALVDCVYALKDISLAKQVARMLMSSGKKLAVAESFTGGGVASALVSSPGMSDALMECIVCYSNESKMRRLGVPETVISRFGAVSADTAFEMANGLLANELCDVALATSGNAGPTAERDGRVGLYYIAIGDRNAIHVFEQFYEVSDADKKSVDDIRREITDAGIKTALYELGKYLKDNLQEKSK